MIWCTDKLRINYKYVCWTLLLWPTLFKMNHHFFPYVYFCFKAKSLRGHYDGQIWSDLCVFDHFFCQQRCSYNTSLRILFTLTAYSMPKPCAWLTKKHTETNMTASFAVYNNTCEFSDFPYSPVSCKNRHKQIPWVYHSDDFFLPFHLPVSAVSSMPLTPFPPTTIPSFLPISAIFFCIYSYISGVHHSGWDFCTYLLIQP